MEKRPAGMLWCRDRPVDVARKERRRGGRGLAAAAAVVVVVIVAAAILVGIAASWGARGCPHVRAAEGKWVGEGCWWVEVGWLVAVAQAFGRPGSKLPVPRYDVGR